MTHKDDTRPAMHAFTGTELHEQFLSGELAATEIARYFLERIRKHDPQVGAFLHVAAERMLAKAEELDRRRAAGEPLGRLAGIPIAIKDNIHIKGEITTCASKFLTNYRAPFDSTVVRLLEQEDALLIGKTNLDEFAMGSSTENSALQRTYNPWDLERTPGGSSGGSAAAVAARFCPIALGTDTGGSIRQPASFCGIVGFKPTYGRVSRFGLVAFGSSLDQIGPMANDVKDAALIMEVVGRHCEKDATSIAGAAEDYLKDPQVSLQGKKVGVPWEFLAQLEEGPKALFQGSLDQMKQLGAEIVDVDLNILKHSIAVYYIVATAEASTNLARFDGIRYGVRSEKAKTLDQVYDYSKEEGFGPEVKRRILLGTYVLSSGYQDAYYRKAQKIRTLIIQQYTKAFKGCDLIAMPSAPSAAFKLNAKKDPLTMYLEDIYTISVNLAGLPAVSLPAGFTGEGLPFGIQLIGPQREDVRVLNAAYALQNMNTYYQSIPDAFKD